MYISRIRIQNYRNFGNPPFDMELKPFTLILGENNIGKSNLLNALGLIFSQELVMSRKRLLELDDINYEAVKSFQTQVADISISAKDVTFPEVKIEVTVKDMDENQEAVVGDWFVSKDMTEARITYLFAPRASFKKEDWVEKQRERLQESDAAMAKQAASDFPVDRYSYSIFGSDDLTNDCDPYFLRMLKMEFLDALRDAQREMVASGEYRLLYRILSQREDANYEDIRKILLQLQAAMDGNLNLVEIKDEVMELLGLISLQSADGDNTIGFTFTSPGASEMLKKIGLRYGTDPVSIERNGLGRNNLLFIALVLSHLSSRDSNGNETFFRLIALEEPEAHLHPHLQDHLAQNIEEVRSKRDKDMQLLMTSHSTHIAAKLSLGNTVILYRENGSRAIKSHYALAGLDPIKEKASIGYLSRYLDATKSRMFFARKVILVEGYAEQLLVPRLFEMHFKASPEKLGCNIVNVQGVAFSHFLKIIHNGFFVKCLVLTDHDGGTQASDRATKLKQDYDSPDLIQVEITQMDTFEKDLIAANKTGNGKGAILEALAMTKPSKGRNVAISFADLDLDADKIFAEIAEYKTEFASNLALHLEEDAITGFTIPEYIQRGFNFLG